MKSVVTPALMFLSGGVSQAELRARQAPEGGCGRAMRGGPRTAPAWCARGWPRSAGGKTRTARPGRSGPLAARLVMCLAHLESELGRADYGLALLARAERAADPADRGILLSQRGLMLMRTGRWADALSQLAAAEPLVGHDPELLARVLLNRSVLHLNTGDVRRARNDLRRLVVIAAAAGLPLMAAKAAQNLGYCDLLGGDIPAALRRFDLAAATYRLTAPGVLPSLETDRARALLAAGLADDAAAALDAAIAAFRRQRRDQHLAEAELARAQAARLAGDPATARRWAGLALRRFRARGNHAWAALAELARLRAAFAVAGQSGRRTAHGRIGTQAQELAGLRGHGLPKDAAQAELLAARAFIVAGRPDDAIRCLAAADGRGMPLEVVLLRRLARAELAAADERTGAALAELRAGLAALHNRRGQLGSLDLQTGTAALGGELAGLRPAAVAWPRRRRACVLVAGTIAGAVVPRPSSAAARGFGGGRGAGRAAPARLPDPDGRAERRPTRPGAAGQPGRTTAPGQAAQLASRRGRPGQRPGRPGRGRGRAGRERPGPGQHRRARPAHARGHDRPGRADPADQAG